MAGVEARQRRGRSTASGTIEQELGLDPSSGSQNELRLSAPLDTALPSLDRWVSLSNPSNGENRSEISVGSVASYLCWVRLVKRGWGVGVVGDAGRVRADAQPYLGPRRRLLPGRRHDG